jgi:small subunit ribosomal protein S5
MKQQNWRRKGNSRAPCISCQAGREHGVSPPRTYPTSVYYSGKVLLKPASESTGLIGAVQTIVGSSGRAERACKSLGSSNPHNVVSATINGLIRLRSAAQVAALRGKSVEELA